MSLAESTFLDRAEHRIDMAFCPKCSVASCEHWKRPGAHLNRRYSRKREQLLYFILPCCAFAGGILHKLRPESEPATPEEIATLDRHWKSARKEWAESHRAESLRHTAEAPDLQPRATALALLETLEKREAWESQLFNPTH